MSMSWVDRAWDTAVLYAKYLHHHAHVYEVGDVTDKERQKRRRKNKQARVSRRVNRSGK
jgi:hypothetical protein